MNLQSKHRGNFTRGRVTVNREAIERIREYGLEVEAAAKKALAARRKGNGLWTVR